MGVQKRSLDQPDERRTPAKTTMDLVSIGGTNFARARFEPGWRWSECVKPVVGGERCQVHHIGYAIAGRIHIVPDSGEPTEIAAGDAFDIAPGHDGWVVGNEPYVSIELSGSEITYAKAAGA